MSELEIELELESGPIEEVTQQDGADGYEMDYRGIAVHLREQVQSATPLSKICDIISPTRDVNIPRPCYTGPFGLHWMGINERQLWASLTISFISIAFIAAGALMGWVTAIMVGVLCICILSLKSVYEELVPGSRLMNNYIDQALPYHQRKNAVRELSRMNETQYDATMELLSGNGFSEHDVISTLELSSKKWKKIKHKIERR